MKIHETKINNELEIDNRNLNVYELRNKLIEETIEVSKALDIYYRNPGDAENMDNFYSEIYDNLLILLLILKKLKSDTSEEEAQAILNKHHQKLKNRGWIFGGYWEITFTTELRKKAMKLSEAIVKRKKEKYYSKELNDYVKDKKTGISKRNEV